jgi:protein-L-isoaspartate(D-aspartate) O-methyltransferase
MGGRKLLEASISLQQYQQHLAEHLRAKYHLSENVFEAFVQVPRHPFISHYYTHQPGERNWTRHERGEDTSVWYEHIYQDKALVTQVDEHGRTLSSSSQPGVMAEMLVALDLQPGMRVLEIGTGTGYNAALLAHLAGDPHLVTTMDIDGDAIERAKQVIPQVVGEGMTIVEGNGVDGYSPNMPYDRIMVTAGTATLPAAWLEQLALDGILISILQPRYARLGGILKAQKHEQGLKGCVIGPASFMELRPADYTKRRIQIDFRAPCIKEFPQSLFQPNLLRENYHFAFFLYKEIPDLYVFQKGEDAYYYYSEASPQGYLIFRQDAAELRGEPSCAYQLWGQIVRAYSVWLHCGCPEITQYQVEMEADGKQRLVLATPFGIISPFE